MKTSKLCMAAVLALAHFAASAHAPDRSYDFTFTAGQAFAGILLIGALRFRSTVRKATGAGFAA